MEYYARVCFLSAVFISRRAEKISHLARSSVSRAIKFSNSSRIRYSRQETHAVIIFYIYFMLSGRISKNIGETIFLS